MHSRNNDVNIYVYIMRHIFCCIGVRNFFKFSGSKKKYVRHISKYVRHIFPEV
jgi:hypothetical protein